MPTIGNRILADDQIGSRLLRARGCTETERGRRFEPFGRRRILSQEECAAMFLAPFRGMSELSTTAWQRRERGDSATQYGDWVKFRAAGLSLEWLLFGVDTPWEEAQVLRSLKSMGTVLKKFRVSRGVSTRAARESAGFCVSNYWRYEAGSLPVTLKALRKLERFGLPAATVLFRGGIVNTRP